MSIYIELILVAVVVDYIVGVSGFTTSWREWVALKLHTTESNLKPLKPFDCSTCMSWWCCLIYALFAGEFSLLIVAESAILSLLSYPINQFLIFMREGLNKLIDIMFGWL